MALLKIDFRPTLRFFPCHLVDRMLQSQTWTGIYHRIATHQRIRVRVADCWLSLLNWCLGNAFEETWRTVVRSLGWLILFRRFGQYWLIWTMGSFEPLFSNGHKQRDAKVNSFARKYEGKVSALTCQDFCKAQLEQNQTMFTMNMCDSPKTMDQALLQTLFQFRGNKPNKGYFPVKTSGILNVVILNDMPKRPLKKVLCSRRHAHTCMTAWKYIYNKWN